MLNDCHRGKLYNGIFTFRLPRNRINSTAIAFTYIGMRCVGLVPMNRHKYLTRGLVVNNLGIGNHFSICASEFYQLIICYGIVFGILRVKRSLYQYKLTYRHCDLMSNTR